MQPFNCMLKETVDRCQPIVGHEHGLLKRGLKLAEETGEVCQAIVKGMGDEAIREESADVIITAVSVFVMNGGTYDELATWLDKKMSKWENKEREKKQNANCTSTYE